MLHIAQWLSLPDPLPACGPTNHNLPDVTRMRRAARDRHKFRRSAFRALERRDMHWMLIANDLCQILGEIVDTAPTDSATQHNELTVAGSISNCAERLRRVRSDWWRSRRHTAP